MRARFLRSAFRRLPPVAWRDERIATLERTLRKRAELEERSYGVPSFRRYIYTERRIAGHLRELDPTDRGQILTRKLTSYSFARSHGVDVPRIFGIWDRPEDIDWDTLPDAVVIKSATGTAARGVIPLRRVENGWTPVTTTDIVTPSQIVDSLTSRQLARRVGGPYFAEELLGGAGDRLPVDVKVHAFYGEVGHVLLRRVNIHRNAKTTVFRVILPDGTDAGPVLRGLVHDHDIPVPANLDALMEVAARLSIAIPRAFIRVDLYDIDGRIVFGELTPRPGHLMDYGPEQDERLGHLWERAQARLFHAVQNGTAPTLRFGPGPRELMVGGRPLVPDGAG